MVKLRYVAGEEIEYGDAVISDTNDVEGNFIIFRQ